MVVKTKRNTNFWQQSGWCYTCKTRNGKRNVTEYNILRLSLKKGIEWTDTIHVYHCSYIKNLLCKMNISLFHWYHLYEFFINHIEYKTTMKCKHNVITDKMLRVRSCNFQIILISSVFLLAYPCRTVG